MSNNHPSHQSGRFCWNELITADKASAEKFYGGLFGWTAEAFGGEANYTLFKNGQDTVGGMMKGPQPDLPSHWLPYVLVEDVDATAARAQSLGGKIVVEPFEVPTVGRIAVLVDPQGAAIALLKPTPQAERESVESKRRRAG